MKILITREKRIFDILLLKFLEKRWKEYRAVLKIGQLFCYS